MDPNGILAIVTAFFEALKKILVAFGILKEEKADDTADEA